MRARHLPDGFVYDTIKWNRRRGDVSFLQSPDWDTSPEPLVGDSCKVGPDGGAKLRRANRENPQIYHHKYSFVAPDYAGFSTTEARRHAEAWQALNPDLRRIGYKRYWDSEVVPKLQGR